MDTYNFLYTSDYNYFSHTLTSIYSLILNNQNINCTIHIIEDEFSDNEYKILYDLEKIFRNVNIKIYSINKLKSINEYYNIPKWRNTNIPNARLFFSEIIKNIDKIMYIDSDTIIVNNLKQAFIGDTIYPVCLVKEIYVPSHLKENLNNYYNTGVILFDYKKWVQDSFRIFDIIKTMECKLVFPDQDILNLAMEDNIGTMDASYNIYPPIQILMKYPYLAHKKLEKTTNFYSYEEIKKAIENPHIYHSYGVLYGRFWDNNKINPFNSIYEQYRTIWDSSFVREDNKEILNKIKMVPFLNTVLSVYMSEDSYEKAKIFIKKNILKKK